MKSYKPEDSAFDNIIHKCPAMVHAIKQANLYAPKSISILIQGENGTGKETFARSIHNAGKGKNKPFVKVKCGGILKDDFDVEFFGDENRQGYFEQALGGTLYLDEIGDLPIDMQIKILQVLEEEAMIRKKDNKKIKIDIRIIASTKKSLINEAAEGRFHDDLFYHIACGVITLPPLRDRAGDILLIIDSILDSLKKESNKIDPSLKDKKIANNAKTLLQTQYWIGNIRQLKNTITRAALNSENSTISKNDVQSTLLEIPSQTDPKEIILNRLISDGIDIDEIKDEVEIHYIKRALDEAGNNKSEAARLLGLSYHTFHKRKEKLEKEYNINIS